MSDFLKDVMNEDLSDKKLEQMVLSSCIQSEECLELGVDGQLKPDDFTNSFYGEIWRSLVELFNSNQPIDEVILVEQILSKGSEDIDADKRLLVALNQLVDSVEVVNIAKFRTYLNILKEHSKLRRLKATLSEITDSLNDKTKSAEELSNSAEQAIFELNAEATEIDHIYTVSDLVPEVMKELTAKGSDEIAGVMTGISELDGCLRGLKNGQLFIVAARPSVGKTAFALNIAYNVAKSGKGVLFVSLEMAANELMNRLLALMSGVNLKAYRDGYCRHGANLKVEAASAELGKLPIVIDDYCFQGSAAIMSTTRRMQRKFDVKLVVIDYLQLISPRNISIPREQQIAEISRMLKFMAKSLNVPVICLAQLNRASEIENRTPRLSDLRESGTIEQDADIVAFLDKSEAYHKIDETSLTFVERDLIVAKNRSGTTARVRLMFNRGALKFEPRASDDVSAGDPTEVREPVDRDEEPGANQLFFK